MMLEVKSLTHNINRPALAILALLMGEVPIYDQEWPDEFENRFEIETSVFYNGRENGICLTVKDYSTKRQGMNLVIYFGENRNSDSIFVADWLQGININPPTIDDFTDKSYSERQYFNYDQIIPAVNYIQKLIIDYCDSFAKETN